MKKHFQLLFMLTSLSPTLYCASASLPSSQEIVHLPAHVQFNYFITFTKNVIDHSDSASCIKHIRQSIVATNSTRPYPELIRDSQGLGSIKQPTLLLLHRTDSFLEYLTSKLNDPVALSEQSEKKNSSPRTT